ncbi:hypothetical protein KCV07_g217, partial [Aureobasidium melanogenum]
MYGGGGCWTATRQCYGQAIGMKAWKRSNSRVRMRTVEVSVSEGVGVAAYPPPVNSRQFSASSQKTESDTEKRWRKRKMPKGWPDPVKGKNMSSSAGDTVPSRGARILFLTPFKPPSFSAVVFLPCSSPNSARNVYRQHVPQLVHALDILGTKSKYAPPNLVDPGFLARTPSYLSYNNTASHVRLIVPFRYGQASGIAVMTADGEDARSMSRALCARGGLPA